MSLRQPQLRNLARSGRTALIGAVLLSAVALAGMTCRSEDDQPPPTTPVAPVVPVAATGLEAMSGRAKTLDETGPANHERFIALSVGEYHNCALREDGRALCWGEDTQGQLAAPVDEQFVAISAGTDHSCGLRAGGSALCWGRWEYRGTRATSMLDERLVAISSGGYHVCGLREDGTAICWGTRPGDRIDQWSPPGETFIAIFSMAAHSCGIRPDGSTHCWNNGLKFQAPEPTRREHLASLSRGNLCDLNVPGEIVCLDWYGGPPYDVLPGEKLRYMGSSWDWGYRGFICGIRPDGSAACSPVTPDSDQDWYIPKIPSTQRFLDIGTGIEHACGLLADGSIRCWGSNLYGQAMPPPTQPGPPPAPPSEVICNPGVVIEKGSGCKMPDFTKTRVRRFAVAADGLGIVYEKENDLYETRYVSIDISFAAIPVQVSDGWFKVDESSGYGAGSSCEGSGNVRDLSTSSTLGQFAYASDSVASIQPPPSTRCTVLAARADVNGNWIIEKALVWEGRKRGLSG